MTAPAKAAPMREDVTQATDADRDAAIAAMEEAARNMDDDFTDFDWDALIVAFQKHRLAHTARPDAVSIDATAWSMDARPDAGDEDVERVARALNNIEYEANRENGGLVHLKRCVAVQVKEARAALAAMREGVDRGMVEREALKRVVSDCQLAINALGNSDRMFDSVVSGFGIIRDRAAAALSPEQPR